MRIGVGSLPMQQGSLRWDQHTVPVSLLSLVSGDNAHRLWDEGGRRVRRRWEPVAGGHTVCQGNPPGACTNKHYLAPIDLWAEQPAGRLRINCLHLQKPPCALSKTVLHPRWLTCSRSQGEACKCVGAVGLVGKAAAASGLLWSGKVTAADTWHQKSAATDVLTHADSLDPKGLNLGGVGKVVRMCVPQIPHQHVSRIFKQVLNIPLIKLTFVLELFL